MLSKVSRQGLQAILIVSMVGMGTSSYLPVAYAESSINQEDTTNTLAKLEVEGIKLDQDFSADVTNYTATVANSVKSINLLVESNNKDAAITINEQTITNGSTNAFSLQTGENTFIINVKDGTHSDITYKLTVTRQESANNLLQSLTLSTGTISPKFSAAVTEYSVQLKNDISTLVVTPKAQENSATIEVNGSASGAQGTKINVPVGKSDIVISVTAENGNKKKYTLHVVRAETINSQTENKSEAGNKNENGTLSQNTRSGSSQMSSSSLLSTSFSQNADGETQNVEEETQKVSKATLSAFTVSEGTWDSAFTTDEFTYHIALSSDVKTITLKPTASYSDSTILIEGGTSKTIELEADHKTIISVVVKNGDDDRKTYVLVFDQD